MERAMLMPRDIPVGNGRFLICFDQNYGIRGLSYPHGRQENHIGGHFFRPTEGNE
jgi:hypothetical protein